MTVNQSVEPINHPAREYAPPAIAVVVFVLLVLASAAWFVDKGLAQLSHGRKHVASSLLRVVDRDEIPRDFSLSDWGGQKVDLQSLKDKVVMINFWATWCPPCVEEMPSITALYETFKNEEDFRFLAISTDEDWQTVRTFFATDNPPFPIALDVKGHLANSYGTTKFPETYVLVDGRLVGHIIGPRDWGSWFAKDYIASLLEEKAKTR